MGVCRGEMQEPWQANLQELEPPTCGGEKRTFRKRPPKECGAADGSEQPEAV